MRELKLLALGLVLSMTLSSVNGISFKSPVEDGVSAAGMREAFVVSMADRR